MARFESEESAFNFAIEYLKQISESLKMCSFYSVNEDIDNWCKWLRNLYRQLAVKVKDGEEKEFLGNYKEPVNIKTLTDNIIEDSEANFKNIYFLMQPNYRKRYKGLILFLLDRLEVKMRKKLQLRGMLLPSKSDPKFAVLER